MGNFFQKEIICDECHRQNIKPDFFQIEIEPKTMHNQAILIDYLPIIIKIDKYSNTLENVPINNMNNMHIIKCTCSNNHLIKCHKIRQHLK